MHGRSSGVWKLPVSSGVGKSVNQKLRTSHFLHPIRKKDNATKVCNTQQLTEISTHNLKQYASVFTCKPSSFRRSGYLPTPKERADSEIRRGGNSVPSELASRMVAGSTPRPSHVVVGVD